MMFFTGFTRFSSDVQKANAAGKQDKTAQLKEMLALVDDAERVLTDTHSDLDDFWPYARPHMEAKASDRCSSIYQ